jgi:hypothetical protein
MLLQHKQGKKSATSANFEMVPVCKIRKAIVHESKK